MPARADVITKQVSSLTLKAAGDNECTGSAAVMGNMDRGGDVIFPGAFSDSVLADFIQNGFVGVAHEWDEPIGMPTMAKAEGNSLTVGWVYHTTDDAMAARTVAQERMAANKSVGLSIGFACDYKAENGVIYFPNGETLLAYAAGKGYDMTLFDSVSIMDWKRECRAILIVKALYEFSQVTVPMNPAARATSIKTLFGFDGSRTDLSLADHLDAVRIAAKGLTSRMADWLAMRDSKGRGMNAAYLEDLKTVRSEIDQVIDAMEKARPADPADVLALQREALMLDLVTPDL